MSSIFNCAIMSLYSPHAGKYLLIAIFSLLYNSIILAQSQLINISAQHAELKTVLNSISSQNNIQFAYDNDLIIGKRVTVEIKNQPIEKALKIILSSTNLDYRLSDNTYLIYEAPKTNFFKKTIAENKQFTILEGTVKDTKTGEPLPYASIKINHMTPNAWSNADGYFSISTPLTDSIVVSAIFMGYNTKTLTICKEDIKRIVEFELTPTEHTLQEIIVNGEAHKMLESSNQGNEKYTINPQYLGSIPNFGEKDAFKTIQLLPGISGSTESAADIRVQGGTFDQNLVLFDGFTVYHLDHFFGLFSAFNSDAIKNIDIYKSGFGAKYGGRISSIIDIAGKSGNFNNISGTANISLISASATLELPIVKDKLSLFVAIRRSYTDMLGTYLFDKLLSNLQSSSVGSNPGSDDYYFNNLNNHTSFYFYDVNAKLTFRPTPVTLMSLSVYRGKDNFSNRLDNAFTIDSTNTGYNENNLQNTSWGNVGYSMKWAKKWNPSWYTKINVAYSSYYSFYSNEWRNNYFDSIQTKWVRFSESTKNKINDFTGNFAVEYQPNTKNRIEMGISTNSQSIYYKYNTDYSQTHQIHNTNIYSLYLLDIIDITNSITINAGIRNTYNDLTANHYIEPRVSLNFKLSKSFRVTLSYGNYNQFIKQTYNSNIMSASHDFWTLANGTDIPTLYSTHYTASMNYSYKNIHITGSIYRKENSGISIIQNIYKNIMSEQHSDSLFIVGDSVSTTSQLTSEAYIPVNQYISGNNIINGCDIMVYKNSGIWNAWASFSYFDRWVDYDKSSTFYLADMGSLKNTEIKTVHQLNFGKWYLSSIWTFSMNNLFSKNINQYYINLSDGKETRYLTKTINEAKKAFIYHRLDFAAGYTIKYKHASLSGGLSLINVYNRANIKLTQYYLSYWDSEAGTITSSPNLVGNAIKLAGFTPVLFLSIDF